MGKCTNENYGLRGIQHSKYKLWVKQIGDIAQQSNKSNQIKGDATQ